jgi:hypothetical protein
MASNNFHALVLSAVLFIGAPLAEPLLAQDEKRSSSISIGLIKPMAE